MDKKWIWLVLSGVVAAIGAVLIWSGRGAQAPEAEAPVEQDSPFGSALSDPDAPALGVGKEQIAPSVPGARSGANQVPDAQSPHAKNAPAPGFNANPPSQRYESFNSQPNQNAPSSPPPRVGNRETAPGDPPPSSFDPIPPQAFENPDFVTPPPPPPQFETEPPPFEQEAPPPPQPPDGYDPNSIPPDDSEPVPLQDPEGF